MSVIYGTTTRPHLARSENRFFLNLPASFYTGDACSVPLDPDVIRELVVSGIHALEDQAHADQGEGLNSSATLAYRYLKEAVLR